MSKPIGYIIQRDDTGELFQSYKHPGTKKVGHPVWTERLLDSFHNKAAIYDDIKSAADVALSIFTRDGVRCAARALVIYGDE